jgi:hypothetical protein
MEISVEKLFDIIRQRGADTTGHTIALISPVEGSAIPDPACANRQRGHVHA